ncbi:MAG: OadG family protein [Clostridia bacterium]|nr:OadG family protein [Clostridia bacterium]
MITIGDAAITALLGYAVVFMGLVSLMIVVMIVGKIMSGKKAEAPKAAPAAPAAVPAAPAPGSAGELKLYDTPDRDAAMVMAIVADKLGKPLNELRFISIKEVK